MKILLDFKTLSDLRELWKGHHKAAWLLRKYNQSQE